MEVDCKLDNVRYRITICLLYMLLSLLALRIQLDVYGKF